MSHTFNLSRTYILFLTCLFNIGCQSGIVTIQNTAVGGKTSSEETSENRSSDEQSGALPPPASINNTVFFTSVASNLDQLPKVIGLHFLAADSYVDHPFGFHLASAQFYKEFFWSPVFLEGEYQISWIELPMRGMKPHLKILNPSSLTTLDRGEVFQAVSWSLSTRADWIAGITEDGKALLQDLINNVTAPLLEKELSKESKALQLSSRKQVAILDSSLHRIDLFSVFEPNKVLKSWNSNVVAASPSGAYVITVDNHRIQIIETDSNNISAISVEIVNLRSPQWKDDKTLAFVSGPEGQAQIQVLNLDTNTLFPISSLSVNGFEEILVCPAWIKDELFYADKAAANSWNIWKVHDPFLKSANPTLFLQPLGAGKGYVCPKGIAG